MPELRRSTRNKTKPAVEPAAEPPVKKAKTEKKPAAKSESNDKTNGVAELQVGDHIPDLTLLDEDENEINLPELAKKTKYLVVFAYPKASTPGCTRQACGFRDNFNVLKGKNTTIYGLSSDSPKAQKNFITKQHLQYSLLSDPHKEFIGPLGAKKSPSGIKRSHWIFVDGVLTIKKVGISPEDSFTGAKKDIEELFEKDAKKEDKEDGKDAKKEDEKEGGKEVESTEPKEPKKED